eukprot:gene8497-biopygen6795
MPAAVQCGVALGVGCMAGWRGSKTWLYGWAGEVEAISTVSCSSDELESYESSACLSGISRDRTVFAAAAWSDVQCADPHGPSLLGLALRSSHFSPERINGCSVSSDKASGKTACSASKLLCVMWEVYAHDVPRFLAAIWLHLTRLETRTKESNMCPSLGVTETRRHNESKGCLAAEVRSSSTRARRIID